MTQRSAPLRNAKVSQQAKELESELNRLLEKYRACTPLRESLMEVIAEVHKVSERDRKSDRDAVLKAICEQGCRTKPEVIEDTGLSAWIVRGVLEELSQKGLLKIFVKTTSLGGRVFEYHPA